MRMNASSKTTPSEVAEKFVDVVGTLGSSLTPPGRPSKKGREPALEDLRHVLQRRALMRFIPFSYFCTC